MTTTETIKFVQFHQPPLESGEYHINVTQTLESGDKIPQQTYTRDLTFAVLGERFGPIPPDEIYAVFPPPESLGEHANVLPHITFKRSTLPWERYPSQQDDDRSWLVLLLFRESDFIKPESENSEDVKAEADKPKTQSITLQELQNSAAKAATPKFPNITLELGQAPEQSVTVLDVKKRYVANQLPTYQDLDYIAHVRQATDNSRSFSGDEYATVICNRLPEPNGLSTVHLVSVEGRYADNEHFDFQGAEDNDLIRFVSLASWDFACVDPAQTFTELVKNLNYSPCSPRLSIRLDSGTEDTNIAAQPYLNSGYVPLPHELRQGSQTVSWYRGPLIPGENPDTIGIADPDNRPPIAFPIKAADALLRYDPALSLFDTSYAAAWQLGRLLTLQKKSIAIELYNWKRANAHYLHQLENSVINLPLGPAVPVDKPDIPNSVKAWFTSLELLQGVPFNYLIPDARLLPVESIRFFWVDSLWVDCLQDGAFSIGRVTDKSVAEDQALRTSHRTLTRNADQKITGVMMRSQVVTGWPHLLIDGYDERGSVEKDVIHDPSPTSRLPLLRMEKLAKDVVLCLFSGEVKTVDVHLQPEAMHFGVDAGKEGGLWSKNLRNDDGEILENSDIDVPVSEDGVIDLTQFASKMQDQLTFDNLTSDQFGLQMIEGVQKVRFTVPALEL